MTVNPVELAKFDLEKNLEPDLIPGGVTVGIPEDELTRPMGYIAVDTAGQISMENIPLLKQRMNVRCITSSLSLSLEMAADVRKYIHQKGRRVVTQQSDGKEYLIHRTWVMGGPQSSLTNNQDLFEQVLFCDYLVGEQEVAVA